MNTVCGEQIKKKLVANKKRQRMQTKNDKEQKRYKIENPYKIVKQVNYKSYIVVNVKQKL